MTQQSNQNMTRALAYRTSVCQDIIRSHTITIDEIWIPEHKIAFNNEGGVFKTDEPRTSSQHNFTDMPTEEIFIPTEYINKLVKIGELDDELKKLKQEYEQNDGIKSKMFPIKFQNSKRQINEEDNGKNLEELQTNSSCVIV